MQIGTNKRDDDGLRKLQFAKRFISPGIDN
jgi:hypothetical protein